MKQNIICRLMVLLAMLLLGMQTTLAAAIDDVVVATASGDLWSVTPGGAISHLSNGYGAGAEIELRSNSDVSVALASGWLFNAPGAGGAALSAANFSFTTFDDQVISSTDNSTVLTASGDLWSVTPGGAISHLSNGYGAGGDIELRPNGDVAVATSSGWLFNAPGGGGAATSAANFSFTTIDDMKVMSNNDMAVLTGSGDLWRVDLAGNISHLSNGYGAGGGIEVLANGNLAVTTASGWLFNAPGAGGAASSAANFSFTTFDDVEVMSNDDVAVLTASGDLWRVDTAGGITFLSNGYGAGGDIEVLSNDDVAIATSSGWLFNAPGAGGAATSAANFSFTTFDDMEIVAIPEPATLGLFALLGGGMLWIRKRFTI